ncbi:MAG: lyase family protein [Planctomycetota bacterium]
MTTSKYDTYQSPLASRNASPAMLKIWSPRHKFNTWRRIWLAVAEAQQACGLDISDEQIAELRSVVERGITDAELERAAELERELRHDVMAHVHCLGESAPKAKPILHLGCTSQDVVCNADLLLLYEATELIDSKLSRSQYRLGEFAAATATIPTLGFTHYQPAQPTTVGRRAVGWAYDLWVARYCISKSGTQLGGHTLLRGLRGATGTQASFLALFDGDRDRVDNCEAAFLGMLHPKAWWHDRTKSPPAQRHSEALANLENRIARQGDSASPKLVDKWKRRREELIAQSPEEYVADYSRSLFGEVTFEYVGQTYPRLHDTMVLSGLASIASVLHKIATDIRLLSNRKEIDEPFGDKQIGSSAMPYKRNPMRCERICGLTRFVMNLVGNAYDTAATQWLERTLDDSSNRRLSLPEAFLALDGALDLMHNVASGLVVHEAMVRKNLMAELPFLATENILMEAVKAGGDRQDLHEKIRVHAQEAGLRVKRDGLDNDLIERLRNDPAFDSVKDRLTDGDLLDPMQYVGRSVEQVERFVKEVVEPLREGYADDLARLEESEPRV